MQVDYRGRSIQLPVLPLVAIVLVAAGAFMSMRLGRIDASDVGILINNITGKITVRLEPGSFFYNGFYTDLHTIDKTIHTLQMRGPGGEVKIKTVEGADVALDVEVNFRLLLDENAIKTKVIPESGVGKLRESLVSLDSRGRRRRTTTVAVDAYRQKWIRDYSRSVVRYVFGSLETEEFYKSQARDDKARECEVELNRLLRPHGLEVLKVVPDEFRFYREYEDKINEKNQAKQEVEREKVSIFTARADQAKQVVEATKRAEVEIETIKGRLAKNKIEAEALAVQVSKKADAYAYTTKIEANASFYSAERNAKGILAAAKAEAESLANLVKALAGEGGRNLVLRELAVALRKARIEGIPYATSAIVQRLSVDGALPTRGAVNRGAVKNRAATNGGAKR